MTMAIVASFADGICKRHPLARPHVRTMRHGRTEWVRTNPDCPRTGAELPTNVVECGAG